MKVQIMNKAGLSFIVNLDKNTRLYPHFTLTELANNKGDAAKPQMILDPDVDSFMCMIESFRAWWNKPMTCNSCYRQAEYNKTVGGAANSLHLHALAFDWAVKLTYADRVRVASKWNSICKDAGRVGGINFYTWGCHLDAHEDRFGYTNFVIRDGNKVTQQVPRP